MNTPRDKKRLTDDLNEVIKVTKGVGRFSKTTRRGLYFIFLLLLPDLGLTSWAINRTIQDHKLSSQIQSNAKGLVSVQQEQFDGCNAGNTFRTEDLTFWATILPVLFKPQPSETAEQKARSTQFLNTIVVAVQVRDKPRSCAPLAPTTTLAR